MANSSPNSHKSLEPGHGHDSIGESPKVDKKMKNFSALLKARAKIESRSSDQLDNNLSSATYDGLPRPDSSASTVRPDSVLSFRSEIPNTKQSDFGAFRPESVSALPPDAVTTIRPDSVAALQGAGQGVFRPFQPPSGPTTRFNIQYQPSSEADWEAKDEMRQRELEEMRARAAQMEKTMRWWSDCTANWREKWSKVRNERNKTREDCRQLRSKLEVVVKECAGLKREKQDLITEIDKVRAELEIHTIKDPDKDSDSMSTGSSMSSKSHPDDLLQSTNEVSAGPDESEHRPNTSKHLSLSMVEAKLKELTKMYNAERDEKETMKCKVADLKIEINSLKTELSDMCVANDKLQVKLDSLQNTGREAASVESEEQYSEKAQQQVETLRGQLEKMQVENAAEWAKREKIASEKHSLERENKKLVRMVEELQEEVRRRHSGLSSAKDLDIKSLQDELSAKTKEYSELRQMFGKQKKQLQEASTELSHSNRRAEQYEQEVKRLRSRIEEVKDDLITAENETDIQTNLVRKLQRTCEDLQQTVESYHSQIAHLQCRLKANGISTAELVLEKTGIAESLISENSSSDNDLEM
ncbi:CCDC102A [Bugula neritina]|uniref:Coiled-coil domain-containing protein 102A n=1 Tax=Bugula neritina TaxID=10212 RepID=A0A7J7IUR3_BUGNE|nr:CCDC102A [Bugula neritina]